MAGPGMIRMKVRKEELIGFSQPHTQLKQTRRDAASAIEKQSLAAGLHKHTRSEAIDRRLWAACAQQGHSKVFTVASSLWQRVAGKIKLPQSPRC